MNFTYDGYIRLYDLLQSRQYNAANYHNYTKKCVILRHDIDFDIDAALNMAEIEYENNIKSTYFVIVTSDFYNVHSLESRIKLKRIVELGHEIGVHYDELAYPNDIGNIDKIIKNIQQEGTILEDIVGQTITTVSMHRPSQEIIEKNISIPGFINSYGIEFFHEFKYVSDSRRCWREPIEKYIDEEKYDKLHILTHPFWYKDEELGLTETLKSFVKCGNVDRYDLLDRNFTNLSNELSRGDINE